MTPVLTSDTQRELQFVHRCCCSHSEAHALPEVSVIMIFLNPGRFFEAAIESVRSQTFMDWELILVDDGSSDGSTDTALGYAEKYPERIRYQMHPGHINRGTAASRNLGLAVSRGKYIAFLDSDDIYLSENLEHQVNILSKHPEAGMVIGRTLHWYSWRETDDIGEMPVDRLRKMPIAPGTLCAPPMLVPLFLRNRAETPGTCSVLIRREVIEKVGFFDEEFSGLFEDQALFYKICLRTPVYVDDEISAYYRQHPGSTCATAVQQSNYHPLDSNPVHQRFLEWFADYLTKQSISENSIPKALRRAQWQYRHAALATPLKRGEIILRNMAGYLRKVIKRTLPIQRRPHSDTFAVDVRPAVGALRWGSFRRSKPISRDFGFDRGVPVDRYYIENFLEKNRSDVQGRVLEIGDNSYTTRYGGERVSKSDVLHVNPDAPGATIIGDLTHGENIPDNAFDCFIQTQTLHLIYDFHTAIRTSYRVLKPGGVLLLTIPGITPISHDEWQKRWYWSFTPVSSQIMFGDVFGADAIEVTTFGNVLAAVSLLHGVAVEELQPSELDVTDPHYPVLITVRAVKRIREEENRA